MTNTPRRRSDVNARPVEGEVVVLDRKTDLVHHLNQTAGFVWERCDGRSTPAEIAAQLVEAFEVDLDTAKASVAAVLRKLDELGLLDQPSR